MKRLRALRETDARFDEICSHFEIMLAEANKRFGDIDTPTVDLRREIEVRLRAPSHQANTVPGTDH